jgi:hypothetical protein
MPLISRLYIIVTLPKGDGVRACVCALTLMLACWVLAGIEGVVFASALPTPVKWVFFGLGLIPLLGCIAMFIVSCWVAIKEDLRRAAEIEIRKPRTR